MPHTHILTPSEYAVFEMPPVLISAKQQRFFVLSQHLENLLSTRALSYRL